MTAARIVLIDDDEVLRETFADILTRAGHQVALARSGSDGLDVVRRERPDLVICDVHMPGLSGYDVLRALRADERLASMPFLFLTSLGTSPQVRAGMSEGADDYLTKPIASRDLLAAVQARLARRDALREEANRRIEEMGRSLALSLPHEMRSPLTTILGNARLLESLHRDMPPEEVEEMARSIVQAARRLHRLFENHLLYATLELQRLSGGNLGEGLSGSECGAGDAGEAALACANERERSGDLRLGIDDVRLPIAGTYLRKIATELVDNALKFSEPGQGVTVSIRPWGSEILLEVVDEGRGMTAEQIGEVSAFRQFDRALFEQQGTGLGLALVRKLAEVSGGRFDIQPRTPGTRVAVRWPASSSSP